MGSACVLGRCDTDDTIPSGRDTAKIRHARIGNHVQTEAIQLPAHRETGKPMAQLLRRPLVVFALLGALAGQPVRIGSATAHTPSTVIAIEKAEMKRLLHEEHALSDGFIAHLLTRNVRIEEDLIDQLFNSAEKRLARTLLLLARYGETHRPQRVIPKISQETLAEIGAGRVPAVTALNKIDRLTKPELARNTTRQFPKAVAISARRGTGQEELLEMITTGVLPKDTNPQAEPSNHKRGGKDGHLGILQEAVRLMSTTHELVQTLASASIRQRQQAQLLHERISAIKAKMR